MKTSFISAISFLAALAAAAPSPPTVRVQLTNDQSGRNANKVITADGTRYTIPSLYAGTAVDSNGSILASAVQLTAFPRNVQCAIFKERLITVLTPQKTYGDLDGDSTKAIPVNLNDAYIECNGSD